jgi:PTH1 family peptidyl-tRNA hydrolase
LGTFLDWLFGKREPEVKPELLVFGLGNPGVKYAGTRHNIGFDIVDRLCAVDTLVSPSKTYCEADCRMMACGPAKKPVLFVKPLTYMNLSGGAVSALIRKYGLTAADCLVVVDDFNIPLGKIRFRKDGSPGGHNGLKSISAAIGSDYPRLRVGIGPLPAGISIIDFVLGRFDSGEREEVDEVVKIAAAAVDFMIENGVDTAMNRYN